MLFYETILQLSCRLGYYDIVRYLVSLQEFDLTIKSILFNIINGI